MLHITVEKLPREIREDLERAARNGDRIAIDFDRKERVYVAESDEARDAGAATRGTTGAVRDWLALTDGWIASDVAQARARTVTGRDWRREDLYDPDQRE